MDRDQTLGFQLDRRRLLTRAAQIGGLAAIGGPLIAACGSSSSGGTPASSSASAAGSAAATSSGSAAAAADLGELKYQLSWIKNVEFAGSYIADTNGFYTKNGFSKVTLIGGGPTATPAETVVVTGKAMVATSSPDATAAAIAKGAPLKVIAAQYQKSPFAIMSLAKTPIATPQDMYGKSIGVQSDNDNVWAAFLKANKLDASKINKVPVQFDPLPLAQGKVDGWFSFITNEPIDLGEKGYKTHTFLLADYNYPLVGNTYCATTDTISKNPAALKAFLKSEIQGWKAAIANPALGAKLTTTVYGKGLGLATGEQTLEAKAENALITVNTSGSGILSISPATQAASVKTLAVGGTKLTTSQLFDTSLIEAVYTENPDLPELTDTRSTASSGPSSRSLLRGAVVLPMAPSTRVVLEPGSVLIEGETILAVGAVDEVDAHPLAVGADVIDLSGHALLPGLQNCHLHSGLLRGTAEGLRLFEWLEKYVDPAHRALTPEIARAASRLCYAEALLSGTTSVMDMWRFLEGSAEVAGELGLRATLVPYAADAPGYDFFESMQSTEQLLDSVSRQSYGGRVRAWVGLEHLLYCTPEAFAQGAELARRYDTGIHTHSSETPWEVEESVKRFGLRPVHEIERRGILDEGRCVIAHCVWLDDAEIETLAATGTRVAHCPCSNMKLASGVADVPRMRSMGVTVGLGSDGEKENNSLDLFEEMKFASLLQKVTALDPTLGDPYDILAMATVDGAACLGLDDITGSLVPGKRADLVAVDLSRPHFTPLLTGVWSNIAPHLVFNATGADVAAVWVDGRLVVADGVLQAADIMDIRADAQAAAEELFDRRDRLPVALPA